MCVLWSSDLLARIVFLLELSIFRIIMVIKTTLTLCINFNRVNEIIMERKKEERREDQVIPSTLEMNI